MEDAMKMKTSEPLLAGFAEVDITPPVGTRKIGWLCEIVAQEILDPLYARVCVLRSGGEQVAIVQLDTLMVTAGDTRELRSRLERTHGFPPERVMVAATHNHAGPAVGTSGDTLKEEGYTADMLAAVEGALTRALEALRPAEIGFGHTYEWGVSQNRRVVMRDGTVRTHGTFDDPLALCLEGPIDPELAVVAVREAAGGPLLGALVNFSCHPTHHGGDTAISAGYPGVLADALKAHGCPVPMFLNGACGNVHTADPCHGGADPGMEVVGRTLAEGAWKVMGGLEYSPTVALGGKSVTLRLPFRDLTPEELAGTTHGAMRFGAPGTYDRVIPQLVEYVRREGMERAEVQVLRIGEVALVAVPGELFVQPGLRIKEASHPAHALIVECANGRIGYLPHREAFLRGGYETTFGPPSVLAPGAAEMIVEAAVKLVHETVH